MTERKLATAVEGPALPTKAMNSGLLAGTVELPSQSCSITLERQLEMIPGARQFCTTHWSLVVASARPDSEQTRAALEGLCRIYWYPVYCYVRKKVSDWHEAQDLTQGFFGLLVARNDFAALNP